MNGFLNILKPPDVSSAGVVAYIRRITGERVGHAGTLDPQAAGILPLMIGRATRLFDFLVEKRKTYMAEIAFGMATDTQDAQGTVIEKNANYPNIGNVENALKAYTGSILQCPPAYSAIKQNGVALYSHARKGNLIETEARPIEVYSMDLLGTMPSHGYLIQVECGKGVYIRTLCHDIGQFLGCPAHMRFLLRTATGVFKLPDAVLLEELSDIQSIRSCLLPPDYPLQYIPKAFVPAQYDKPSRNGAKLPMEAFPQLRGMAAGNLVRLYVGTEFLAILELKEDHFFHFRTMLSSGNSESEGALNNG